MKMFWGISGWGGKTILGTDSSSPRKSSIFGDGDQDSFLTHCGDGAGIKKVYVFREYRGIPRYSPKQNEMQRAIIHWMNIRIFSLYAFHKYKWSINDFWKCTYLNWSTLEFLISIPVRLLLFGYFPTSTSLFGPLHLFFYHYVMGFAYEIYLTLLLSILIEKKSSFKNCTEMIFTNAWCF